MLSRARVGARFGDFSHLWTLEMVRILSQAWRSARSAARSSAPASTHSHVGFYVRCLREWVRDGCTLARVYDGACCGEPTETCRSFALELWILLYRGLYPETSHQEILHFVFKYETHHRSYLWVVGGRATTPLRLFVGRSAHGEPARGRRDDRQRANPGHAEPRLVGDHTSLFQEIWGRRLCVQPRALSLEVSNCSLFRLSLSRGLSLSFGRETLRRRISAHTRHCLLFKRRFFILFSRTFSFFRRPRCRWTRARRCSRKRSRSSRSAT